MTSETINQIKEDIPEIKFSSWDIDRKIKIPQQLTPSLAYLCGILAGDGHIPNIKQKSRNRICCGGNPKDEKEFYDINMKRLFKEVFNMDIIPRDLKGGTYGFKFGSEATVTFLTKIIGLPRGKKYDTLKIPELFLEDKGLILEFVRGLFDTDFGLCLAKKYQTLQYYPQICFDSKSEKFTIEIWQTLKDLGLKFNGKVYMVYDEDERAKAGYTITYRFDMYGHKYFVDIIKLIQLRHPKHIKKYQEWLSVNKDNKKVLKLLNK